MTGAPGVGWLPAPLPHGVHGGFTARDGGVSSPPWDSLNLADHVGDEAGAVAENRRRALATVGVQRLAVARQVHGADVAVADVDWPESATDLPQADAVITAVPGLAVGVVVADCVPLLVADPVAGVVAAVHAGRPGLAAGVVQAALSAMADAGADPARSHAVIGPAVCGRCYEVPEAMRDDVAARVPATASTTRAGTPALDLPGGVAAVLRACGVQVTDVGRCTLEDPAYYSYRRSGTTGRFAGVIAVSQRGVSQ